MTRERSSVQYHTSTSDSASPSARIDNDLPAWDLSDLYSAPDAPELDGDLLEVAGHVKDFASKNKTRIAKMPPAEFVATIRTYEEISQTLHRITSYAQLLYVANVSDPETGRFYQTIHEKVTDISTDTLFFTLEINRLDDQPFEHLLADSDVAHYGPWLRDVRMFRDHELSDELEQVLHQKSVTGRSAWSRLFDETMADMRISIDGEELTLADTLNRLSDTDGRRGRRQSSRRL